MACGDLGIVGGFNLFLFVDHTQSSVDSEGRVAVGGTATYVNYGVGSALEVSTTRPDLIIQGNVNITSGANFAGNTVVSTDSNIINYTMTNNNRVPDQPLRGLPFDFNQVEQNVTAQSINFAAIPAFGTVANNFGQIVLTGSDPELNVFLFNGNNVDGEGLRLDTANGIDIVAPEGSTILINIGGDEVGFGSYTIFRNGVTSTREDGATILWNLYQASSAFNQNLSITGSVLAPNADWSAIGFGNINGTLVANSLTNVTGTLEAHHVPFAGCLPNIELPLIPTTSSTTTTTTTTTTTELPTTTTTTTELPTTTTTTTTTELPTTTTTTTTTELPTTTTTTTTTELPTTTTTTTTTELPTTTTTTTTTELPTTTTTSTTTGLPTTTTTTVSPVQPSARITATKTSNASTASLGDIITYTVTITNSGNAPGEITVNEDLPRGVIFVPASLTIDGVPFTGLDMVEEIALGTINPGQTIVVTFEVVVIAIPPGGQIVNRGNITTLIPGTLNLTCNVGERAISGSRGVTPIPGQLNPILLVYKPGITPTPGNPLAVGPLVLNSGRIVLNRPVTIPGITLPPLLGVTLPVSNGLTTPIVTPVAVRVPVNTMGSSPNLVIVQRLFGSQFFIGQRITYSLYIINNGNSTAVRTELTNILPPGAAFIPGTVRVNRRLLLEADPNNGIQLGPIPVSEGVLVRFDILITGGTSLTSTSAISSDFLLPDQTLTTRQFNSESITIRVQPISLENFFTVKKLANLQSTRVGNIIKYYVEISNLSSSVTAENVILYDKLDAALQYVSGSLEVDGIPQLDPSVGVAIGSIAPQSTRRVSFQVRVQYQPDQDQITNRAIAFLEFRVQGKCYRGAVLSNLSTVLVPRADDEDEE